MFHILHVYLYCIQVYVLHVDLVYFLCPQKNVRSMKAVIGPILLPAIFPNPKYTAWYIEKYLWDDWINKWLNEDGNKFDLMAMSNSALNS